MYFAQQQQLMLYCRFDNAGFGNHRGKTNCCKTKLLINDFKKTAACSKFSVNQNVIENCCSKEEKCHKKFAREENETRQRRVHIFLSKLQTAGRSTFHSYLKTFFFLIYGGVWSLLGWCFRFSKSYKEPLNWDPSTRTAEWPPGSRNLSWPLSDIFQQSKCKVGLLICSYIDQNIVWRFIYIWLLAFMWNWAEWLNFRNKTKTRFSNSKVVVKWLPCSSEPCQRALGW